MEFRGGQWLRAAQAIPGDYGLINSNLPAATVNGRTTPVVSFLVALSLGSVNAT